MITAPSLYNIPIDSYHHDPNLCDGPSISASGLKQIVECPAKYWAFSPYNPRRFEKKETKALDLGRAAHALVLGEPEFAKHFIISPHDEFRTKEAREWRDASLDMGLTVLKASDFDVVQAMAKAQRASPVVMQAFEGGKPEQSLIWRDDETGVWLKARPDWLPDNPATAFVVDYKTALTIEPRKLSIDAFKYGYHIQAAMQMDGVRQIFGVSGLGIAHVVQEKDPPWLPDLRMFSPEALDYGRLLYRSGLRTFAKCLNAGKWPAYTECPQYFETPTWIARQMEEFDNGDDGYGKQSNSYSPADYYAGI